MHPSIDKVFDLFRLTDQNQKVNMLIIGAQKAGTTALFEYLRVHPQFFASRNKEVGFFHKDQLYNKGINYYHSFFSLGKKDKKIFYEATPENLYIPFVPQRIKEYNPDMKLIVMLRDPVKRAFSQWNMYERLRDQADYLVKHVAVTANREYRDSFIKILTDKTYPAFEEFIAEEIKCIRENSFYEPSFLRRGIYTEQLERYFTIFPLENILIIENGSLRSRKEETLKNICNFLGVHTITWPEMEREVKYSKKINSDTEKELYYFFEPYNQKLYELIGQNYNWKQGSVS